MTEDAKVTLSDEQWAYIKRHEDERTKEMNRHNAAMLSALTEALALMAAQNSMEDKRDWFAGQALPEFVRINERVTAGRDNVPYAVALKVTAEQAYALADAMLAARERGK